jgi:DNA replication and repair protein RecF
MALWLRLPRCKRRSFAALRIDCDVILARLTARNFRNLDASEHQFHEQANVIVGRNGQGKTNLLEAIYFLATTKSFRTSHTASMFCFGAPSVFVSGHVQRGGIERTLSVGLEAESKKRVLAINAEKVPLAPYLNALTLFAYSSSRLDILRGAPEERRRFIDRGIASINPGYLEQLTQYTRALKQRNALLHEVAAGRASASTLDAWDQELAVAAAPVWKARTAYVDDLSRTFTEIVVQHRYRVQNVELAYRPAQTEIPRVAEIRARMSLNGPQRDVLDFVVDGRPASEVLSGGEQKMIVLFLKFAKIELFRRRTDDAPVFLLDDIDAELDLDILQDLLQKLPPQTQVFATSAKERFLDVLEAGSHRRLVIENGRVTAAQDFA